MPATESPVDRTARIADSHADPDLAVLGSYTLHERPHPIRWVTGTLVLVVLGWLVWSFANGQIQWDVTASYLLNPRILEGLLNTVILTLVCSLFGLVLGTVFAIMRLSTNPVVAGVAWLYVWIFRGTPELLQLLIWFNLAMIFPRIGIPLIWDTATIDVVSPFVAAVLGLSINTGAYLAENIRGGIVAVDFGQTEASKALGMSRRATLRRVILPQAMPALLPAFGNHVIGLLKGTSLASAIAYTELLGQAQRIYFVNGRVMEILFVIAIWYLFATSVASVGQYYVERHFGRSERVVRRSAVDRLIGAALTSLHNRARRRSVSRGIES